MLNVKKKTVTMVVLFQSSATTENIDETQVKQNIATLTGDDEVFVSSVVAKTDFVNRLEVVVAGLGDTMMVIQAMNELIGQGQEACHEKQFGVLCFGVKALLQAVVDVVFGQPWNMSTTAQCGDPVGLFLEQHKVKQMDCSLQLNKMMGT